MGKELKNKPLVEAILEIRWNLIQIPTGASIDPHYKLLLGRLYDRLHAEYPEHEQLPTAIVPDELVGHSVQHRFRAGVDAWPLVQLGPGIFTLNSTSDYKWEDFRPRVLSAIQKLYDAHPKVSDLRVNRLMLRYIDAVDFDFEASNVLDYLGEYLKLNFSLSENLFKDTGVESKPKTFSLQSSFACQQPKGVISIRFASGAKQMTSALVWETIVQSKGSEVPEMPGDFGKWLDEAHKITEDWFFKMIEGELERRFS